MKGWTHSTVIIPADPHATTYVSTLSSRDREECRLISFQRSAHFHHLRRRQNSIVRWAWACFAASPVNSMQQNQKSISPIHMSPIR